MEEKIRRLGVGILGTGRIGTDLLMKVERSPHLECRIFSGRSINSSGVLLAKSMGVSVSDKSVHALVSRQRDIDIVFDATSASHHQMHAQIFERMGLLAIDLTPAKVGYSCVPSINLKKTRYAKNINLVTCGGQAAIPIAEVLTRVFPDITRLAVQTRVAADSIGPATLENIDNYYASTKLALWEYAGIRDAQIQLDVDDSPNKPDMLTILRAYTSNCDVDRLSQPLSERLSAVQRYVPGYRLDSRPVWREGYIEISIRVRGQGDFLPEYAGNLDIINCAAIAIAEDHAMQRVKVLESMLGMGIAYGASSGTVKENTSVETVS